MTAPSSAGVGSWGGHGRPVGCEHRFETADGVVQAATYLQVGETIRPVRLDGDRRGYVIALADTSDEALRRAETAARLLTVEVEP